MAIGGVGGAGAVANAYQHTSNAHRLSGISNRSVGMPVQNPTQTAIPGILPLQIGNMSAALYFQSPDGDRAELSAGALRMQGATAESMQEILEPQGACETCANRRYVDDSDDMSVSFQTPTNIHPSIAAVKVASHEQEHVRNEQANAERNDRTITHQSVTFQYAVCPDCGRFYVAGGTTRTQSVGNSEEEEGGHEVGPDLGSGVGDHQHNHAHGEDEDGHTH